jgi:GTPase SAR1 family protein
MQSYYRGVMGGIIVYDVTNRSSFDTLPDWIKKIKENSGNAIILIVGNKCDMIYLRGVQTEEGTALAQKYKVAFLETSALENTNVEEAFTMIIREIIQAFKLGNKISSSETPTTAPAEVLKAPSPSSQTISLTQTQSEPEPPKQKCPC